MWTFPFYHIDLIGAPYKYENGGDTEYQIFQKKDWKKKITDLDITWGNMCERGIEYGRMDNCIDFRGIDESSGDF